VGEHRPGYVTLPDSARGRLVRARGEGTVGVVGCDGSMILPVTADEVLCKGKGDDCEDEDYDEADERTVRHFEQM
jgi:hypothetical protein